MRSRLSAACFGAALAAAAASSAWALGPSEVLVLVNKDAPVSSQVGNVYMQMREIPQANVLRLALGREHEITREFYRARIVAVIKPYLREHPAIRAIVTTSGFPYTIRAEGKEDGAAVDNELAAVLYDEPASLERWQPNPLYMRGRNRYGATDPRAFDMVYVTRLDGPDLETISRMVADSIVTEQNGLDGPVFGDTTGLDGNVGAAAADASLRRAIDRLAGAGFAATLDMKPETWRAPAGGVSEQAAGASFYVGWYSLQSFQDIFGKQGLARGSIAWHIASGEAIDPWNPRSSSWCPNLLRRGAAVTVGPAFEPYVQAFPKADIVVEQLLAGRSIAEAYWLALPHVSWAMVILGDPLYRPFARKPKPALVARAYVADTPSHVLGAGQTGPLLVRLECVGPAGSSTPALSAEVSAGEGLAAASGKVEIPALQAGESAVVRVPSVTAGADATGMFRLYLNAEAAGGRSRRISLEGRIGFSAVGADIARQAFVSPKGAYLTTARPGEAVVTEAATLQQKNMALPPGWNVADAAYSPDENLVILTMVDSAQKRAVFALADARFTKLRPLAGQIQFLRWLSNDRILVRGPQGIMEHDLATGVSLPIAAPEGWTANNMIPGTSIVMLTGAGGKVAVRDGSQPRREVLAGVKITRDMAIADDLSQFGGVDEQKRLWLQYGWQAKPEVLSDGVEHVWWGPISRRLIVQTTDGASRLYDGHDGKWLPLGRVLMGRWSQDETRFLYVTGQDEGGKAVPQSLFLLDGQRAVELCSMYRIGDLTGIAMAGDDTAFLLTGPDQGFNVWMLRLPVGK